MFSENSAPWRSEEELGPFAREKVARVGGQEEWLVSPLAQLREQKSIMRPPDSMKRGRWQPGTGQVGVEGEAGRLATSAPASLAWVAPQ